MMKYSRQIIIHNSNGWNEDGTYYTSRFLILAILRGEGSRLSQLTPMSLPVARRTTSEKLLHWENIDLCIGLGVVESGPLIRSNSHADERSQKHSDLRS